MMHKAPIEAICNRSIYLTVLRTKTSLIRPAKWNAKLSFKHRCCKIMQTLLFLPLFSICF